MWFSFTAVGAVTTCIIIVSLWEKFQTNPTITGKYLSFLVIDTFQQIRFAFLMKKVLMPNYNECGTVEDFQLTSIFLVIGIKQFELNYLETGNIDFLYCLIRFRIPMLFKITEISLA